MCRAGQEEEGEKGGDALGWRRSGRGSLAVERDGPTVEEDSVVF